jgi:RNA polymerase sigma-70 factor (ECF subfamily)
MIPGDLAPRLHELLRRHFAGDPGVEVVVERRGDERRDGGDRRGGARSCASPAGERRRFGAGEGRRIAERRAALVAVDAPVLPRRVRAQAQRLVFVERFEPSGRVAEDADTARLVVRIQSGERDAFALLYMRYFDRVYAYLRLVVRDRQDAEDLTQQVFLDILDALPAYRARGQPFRAWLFTIARNAAISHLRRGGRVEPRDPFELDRQRGDIDTAPSAELAALDWISDRELLLFIERLPLSQRQVLVLRYMLDLSVAQVATVLDRTPNQVWMLQHRAHRVLRERFLALGRAPKHVRPVRAPVCFRQMTVLRQRRFALRP